MADNSKSSKKDKAPNFYEAAAQMSGVDGKGAAAGGPAPAADPAEKVTNVQALLEVFKKMDKIENDPDAKALIQQMSEIAQQYLTKVQTPGGGKGASAGGPNAPSPVPPPPPSTGVGASPAPPPTPADMAGAGGM